MTVAQGGIIQGQLSVGGVKSPVGISWGAVVLGGIVIERSKTTTKLLLHLKVFTNLILNRGIITLCVALPLQQFIVFIKLDSV